MMRSTTFTLSTILMGALTGLSFACGGIRTESLDPNGEADASSIPDGTSKESASDPDLSPCGSGGGGHSGTSDADAGRGGSGGSGTGGAAGGTSGSGGTTNCECKRPADTCWETTCAMTNTTCDALNKCPDTHRCEDGLCICKDDRLCGQSCTESEDCQFSKSPPQTCHEEQSTCVPDVCFFDSDCEDGKRCAAVIEYNLISKICLAPGKGKLGDNCNAHQDCESALCDGICLAPCAKNRDCPSGQTCVGTDWPPRCQATSPCPNCAAPNSACLEHQCVTGCAINADCKSDEQCSYNGSGSAPGASCETKTVSCADTEFVRKDFAISNEMCTTGKICWFDSDCPKGTCVAHLCSN